MSAGERLKGNPWQNACYLLDRSIWMALGHQRWHLMAGSLARGIGDLGDKHS